MIGYSKLSIQNVTYLLLRQGRKELDSTTSEYRYLQNVSESPAVTNIYGNKIAIIIWTDEPEGIIIENAATAKAYRSYFDVMWEVAKKIVYKLPIASKSFL